MRRWPGIVSLSLSLAATLFATARGALGCGRHDGPGALPPPISFEPNRGQFDKTAAFGALGPEYRLGVVHGGATWVFPSREAQGPEHRVSLDLVGARRGRFDTMTTLPTISNYALGADSAKWRQAVPHFREVWEKGVYRGVDIVYHGERDGVEYDFIVAPGADPHAIRMRFRGATGLRIDDKGDLVLATAGGELRHLKPRAYQGEGPFRTPVDASYEVLAGEVRFALGHYDAQEELVIDPTVSYSSYIGDSDWDQANAVATDGAGNAYVVGGTTRGGYKDVIVNKIAPNGTLLYRTFLSGSGGNPESALDVAVDAAGNVYLTGWTASQDFPLKNRVQFYGGGMQDAFVTKLDPQGQIVYSTFLGGSGEDHGTGIAVDGAGSAYVVGWTNSPDLATVNAAQATRQGAEDAFVVKLSPNGSTMLFATYLGGSGNEAARAVAVHPSTGVHVVGRTTSSDFPVRGALQTAFGGGGDDAFVTRFDAATGAILSSTYLGGPESETASDVALGADGSIYLTGWSAQPPATNVGYVTKLSPQAAAVVYSTPDRGGESIALDASGNAYVTGGRINLSFDHGYYATPGDAFFFTKLDGAGHPVLEFGGTAGLGLAVDGKGRVVVTGTTASLLFPTRHAFRPKSAGLPFKLDGFVTRINPAANPKIDVPHDDARVQYAGTWAVDGDAATSSEANATAALTFTGTGIELVGRRAPGAGTLSVSLEGNKRYQALDLPTGASATETGALLLSISGLNARAHTLQLTVAGDGPVFLEGFSILP